MKKKLFTLLEEHNVSSEYLSAVKESDIRNCAVGELTINELFLLCRLADIEPDEFFDWLWDEYVRTS